MIKFLKFSQNPQKCSNRDKIFEDFYATVQPKWARIETIWKGRGGIRSNVVVEAQVDGYTGPKTGLMSRQLKCSARKNATMQPRLSANLTINALRWRKQMLYVLTAQSLIPLYRQSSLMMDLSWECFVALAPFLFQHVC